MGYTLRKEYAKHEDHTYNQTNLSIKTIEVICLERDAITSMQKTDELNNQTMGLSREEEGTVDLSFSFRTAERSMIVGSESTTNSSNSANAIR